MKYPRAFGAANLNKTKNRDELDGEIPNKIRKLEKLSTHHLGLTIVVLIWRSSKKGGLRQSDSKVELEDNPRAYQTWNIDYNNRVQYQDLLKRRRMKEGGGRKDMSCPILNPVTPLAFQPQIS